MPGGSFNHAPNPNTALKLTEKGVDVIATQDIEQGEPLRSDYKTYGAAPTWFIELLRDSTGDVECVMNNDYV